MHFIPNRNFLTFQDERSFTLITNYAIELRSIRPIKVVLAKSTSLCPIGIKVTNRLSGLPPAIPSFRTFSTLRTNQLNGRLVPSSEQGVNIRPDRVQVPNNEMCNKLLASPRC